MSDKLLMIQILKGARDLLSDPTHWTQGTYARAPGGFEVFVDDPRAARWCLMGALSRQGFGNFVYSDTLKAIRKSNNIDLVSIWNDEPNRTHAQVLEAIDNTIAAIEKK